jgi:hypothetical protein
MKTWISVAVLLALVMAMAIIVSAISGNRNRRLAASLDSLRLASANALAARDTTIQSLRHDALTQTDRMVAERLAFQAETVELQAIFADSLERTATAAASFRLEADSLHRELVGERAEMSGDTIRVSNTLLAADSIGVDVATEVTIAPDLSTRWLWNVQRAPMVLDVALSCRGDQAVASVAGPAWASIQLDSIVQRSDICIVPTPVAKKPFGFRLPSVPVGTILVLAGVLIGAL